MIRREKDREKERERDREGEREEGKEDRVCLESFGRIILLEIDKIGKIRI